MIFVSAHKSPEKLVSFVCAVLMVEIVFCRFGCFGDGVRYDPRLRVDLVCTYLPGHLIEFGLDFVVFDKSIVVRVQLFHELLDLFICQVLDI